MGADDLRKWIIRSASLCLFSCSSNSIEKGRESSPEKLLGPALDKETPSPLRSPGKGEVLLIGPFCCLLGAQSPRNCIKELRH